jgi:hypothetical protein
VTSHRTHERAGRTEATLADGPVSDVGERPLGREPTRDGVVHRQIQFRAVCADPGPHLRDPGIRRRRVDVNASDDSIPIIEDRVGKTPTSLKVLGVALQVSQVLGQ